MKEIRSLTLERQELPDGYAFRFASDTQAILRVAEFITIERLCCPFLNFRVEVAEDNGPTGSVALSKLVAQQGGATASLLVLTPQVLLAVGGSVAVSIGFALKDLVASVVAGLIILVDRPFQVGDRVTFDGYYGEIREIGLRSVRLMTLDDTQVTIPNSKFLTDVVASGNSGAVEMMIQMDFFVALDQDIQRAKQIVQEALTTSRYVHLKLPWAVLVNQVSQGEHFAARRGAFGADLVSGGLGGEDGRTIGAGEGVGADGHAVRVAHRVQE